MGNKKKSKVEFWKIFLFGARKKSKAEIVFIIIFWLFYYLSPYLLFLFIEWYYVLFITSLWFSIWRWKDCSKSNYSTFKAVIIPLIFNIFGALYVTRKMNENPNASFIKAREKSRAELKEKHKKEKAKAEQQAQAAKKSQVKAEEEVKPEEEQKEDGIVTVKCTNCDVSLISHRDLMNLSICIQCKSTNTLYVEGDEKS